MAQEGAAAPTDAGVLKMEALIDSLGASWLLSVVGTPWEDHAERMLDQMLEPILQAEYDRAVRLHEERFP